MSIQQEPKRWIGTRVEQRALEWWFENRLPEDRSKLIRRNYTCRCGEIDLILEEKQPKGRIDLVFVEVRYRGKKGWVNGVESVDHHKRRKLELTTRQFLVSYRGPATGIRFDILSWDGCSWTHLPNAWYS